MKEFTSRYINTTQLPLVIEPIDKAITFDTYLNLLARYRSYFQESLLKYGGILFRGFPIEKAESFAKAIETLNLGSFVDYIGGDSPRKKVIKGVYTSTEAPPFVKIPLHNELSFVKNYPKHIYFYCEKPSKIKGETILCDARAIYQQIDEKIKNRFVHAGLQYISRYPSKNSLIHFLNKSHKPWTDVFETCNKQQVEQKCINNEFAFSWHRNDWIEIIQIAPAVITHPQTKEKTWFNQAHLFDFNRKLLSWWQNIGIKMLYFRKHTLLHEIRFADHSFVPRKNLYHILDILDQNTVRFPWQRNDLLILDNILTMHGRERFKGKRRILTAMTG